MMTNVGGFRADHERETQPIRKGGKGPDFGQHRGIGPPGNQVIFVKTNKGRRRRGGRKTEETRRERVGSDEPPSHGVCRTSIDAVLLRSDT